MASNFIELDVTTNAQDLLDTATDELEADGWTPNDGDPEVVILEKIAAAVANAAAYLAVMPPTWARKYGTDLVGIPFKDGAPAETTATWLLTDTAGHTIPAGRAVQIGDFFFATTVDVVVAPASNTATGVVLRALDDGAAANGLTGTASLVNSIAWVSTITLEAPTAGGADEEDDDAYRNRLRTELTLIGPRPITAQDFADFALNTPDVALGRTTAFDGYDPFTNLLSANEASLETDTSGWTAGASTSIARVTTQHDDGAASLQLTRNTTTGLATATATEVAAQPGQKYTAMATFKAAATPRSCRVYLNFYNVSHVLIGSAFAGSQITDSTSAFTQATATSVAPAGTAFVGVTVEVAAAIATEVHFADKIGVKLVPFDQATNANWTAGGIDPHNTPRTVTVAGTNPDGTAPSTDAKAAVLAYLTQFREVNFIVRVIDAAYYTGTDVAIAYTFHAFPGYDEAALEDTINAKLASVLSPLLWGQPQGTQVGWANDLVIRHNNLLAVAKSVEGVDYIGTLTINGSAGDFTMTGPVALPNVDASSIAGTPI